MRRLCLFLCIILPCLSVVAVEQADAAQKLFGSKERRSSRLKPFPKWLGVLERYDGEVSANKPCRNKSDCLLKRWNAKLNSFRSMDKVSQIRNVNAMMNAEPYITDPVNWGKPDYWETPYEFHLKDGDCEDYAISKYMSLKALGFNPKDMRVVILMDENLGIHHAILAVYYGNQIYILENQISKLVTHEKIYHYRPIYSINEHNWWRHR